VLQDGEVEPVGAAKSLTVDVRVIAATNKDLAEEIRQGQFREDLFFRLNVIPIVIPSLRDRREDIPELVVWFTDLFCRENNFRQKTFRPQAMEVLCSLPWQGNIRELRNAVERLLIMTASDAIDASDIPSGLGTMLGNRGATGPGQLVLEDQGLSLQEFKEAAEKRYLEARLQEHGGNVAATAKAIQTPRSNLYKKLEAYDLQRGRGSGS
jgi:two-component system nitrogen regulation response regulator NtrX